LWKRRPGSELLRGTGFQPVKHHGQNGRATSNRTKAAPDVKKHAKSGKTVRDDGALRVRRGAYLPHWTRRGATYFVTFRLADSLPRPVLEKWRSERKALGQEEQRLERSPAEEQRKRRVPFSERMEAHLDAAHGACWLKRPRVAGVVRDALVRFDGERYELLAWCIMPNHVHLVVRPGTGHELPDLLLSWKSFTGRQANKMLGRRGRFWQAEYYDHLIRDTDDLWRCVQYTYYNPERAGIAAWPWRGLAADDHPVARAPSP